MLILSRKLQESIMIGDEIEITVLAIDGEQIKIGINAPKSVDIYRKEIYLTIQEENNNAISTKTNLLANLGDFLKQKNN